MPMTRMNAMQILCGDPGATPETFMDEVKQPMLLVWGDEDPFTPLKQGYGTYFAEELVEGRPKTELAVVNAGHCPHDDAPKEVRTFSASVIRRAEVLFLVPSLCMYLCARTAACIFSCLRRVFTGKRPSGVCMDLDQESRH